MKKLYTLTKLFLILFLLGIGISGFGQTYFGPESFDGTTFPPTGWTQTQITGTGLWARSTSGTYPTCTPQSGVGMIKYNYATAGTSAVLITPSIDLTTASNAVVEFWLFRDSDPGYLATADKVEVMINTSSNVTGASLLGEVNRSTSLNPVSSSGWNKYAFSIPASYNSATNYIIIKGTSQNGNNIFVDDIKVYTPVLPSAQPANFTATAVTKTGMTVNWVDNSTNETGFRVYMSTVENGTFTKVSADITSTSPATTGDAYSLNVTGLTHTTNYYFKIVAFVDGESSALTGSQATVTGDPADAAPTSMTFTSVGLSTMTLGWTDNSTNEVSFRVYRSTSATGPFTKVGTDIASTSGATTGTLYSQVQTGLENGTTYYYKVVAIFENESPALEGNQATTTPTLQGLFKVGATGADYASLTAAFADINLKGLLGSVQLELQADYVSTSETFPIKPSAIATATKTIAVYPAVTGLAITSNNTTGTINLDGSKYVTFDGRVGSTGSTIDLAIANTSVSGYAIQLINDASYNIFKYLDLKGESTSTTSGVVVISTTTGTTGNDYNTFDNCNIHGNGTAANLPTNCLYATGTSGKINNNNTITNCNIFDFFNAASTSAGINVGSNNSTYTVTGNKIYQSSARTYTSGNLHYGISLTDATNGVGFTANNNIIGYTNSTQTGVYTMSGSSSRFIGIQVSASVGSSLPSDVCNIQGNTISNFTLTTSSGGSANSGAFTGIYVVGSGTINVGTSAANTIGSTTNADAIKVIGSTTGSTNPFLSGMATMGSGTYTIKNNLISGLTTEGSSLSIGLLFVKGIIINTGYPILEVNNNTIGGNLTNSLRAGATGATASQTVTGIEYNAAGTALISNNTISNLLGNGVKATSANGQVIGIKLNAASSATTTTVKDNTIFNLKQIDNNSQTTYSAALVGILQMSGNGTTLVSHNTIYGLEVSHATGSVVAAGIYGIGQTTGNAIYERNLIYGLNANSNFASLFGMYMGGTGVATSIQNNMISLGYKSDGSEVLAGCTIAGLHDYLGTHNYYFNSVYIGGNPTSGAGNTYALYDNMATNTRNYKNNILVNARSNSGSTGKHYGVKLATSGSYSSDYNIIRATGTGGVFGGFGSTDKADFTTWKASAAGLDANSIDLDPKFANPTAATPDMHLQGGSPADMIGVDIPTITTDFFGDLRSSLSPVDIGADAGNFDNIAPTVVFLPADGATNVSIGTNVTLTFSENIRKTDNSAVDASVISFQNTTDVVDVPFTFDYTNKVITVTPSTSLIGAKTYKVTVTGVEDVFDNALTAGNSTTFTTELGDIIAPTLSSASVENAVPSKVVAVFAENIKLTNAAGFTIKINGNVATINGYAGNNSSTLTFTLDNPVTSHQNVTIEYSKALGNVSDIAGNLLEDIISTSITNNVKSSAKDFVTFNLDKVNNVALISDITGAISANNVDLYIPMGTNISTLIATFTTSDYVQKVEIGSTIQTSGTTSNSFATSLTYKLTAEDNSIKNYTVTVHQIYSAPYTQGFEGTFPPADWMIVNEGLGNSWNQSGTYHSGVKSMYYFYSSNAANAWAYTPALALVSGKKYVVEFWEKVSVQNEKMKVTAGLFPNVAAQTSEVWKNEAISNHSSFEKVKSTFTAPTTDNYHFGFNCFSDANKSNLYVDDITIREIGVDAQLTSLKVDGNSVVGFASGTFTYNIELSYGTTAIPQITESNLSDVNATKVLTQATSLNGTADERTAKVEVTAEDGVTKHIYSIVFTVAKNNVATLSDLKVDGVTVNGFSTSTLTLNIELPYGTSAIPQITEATLTDVNASKVITQANNLTGTLAERTAKVEVTAEDGVTKNTYSVVFTVAKNNVATLSDLKVDGTTVSGFVSLTLTYNIELPCGTTAVPQITEATLTDANASRVITQATNLTGTIAERSAKVEVTAENGIEKQTYSVIYTVAKNNVATLSDLKVNGTTVSGFASSTFTYDVELPYGTTAVPQITEATLTDSNASKAITQAINITGTIAERTAKIEVTAENGIEKQTYSIIFTVAAPTTYAVNFSVIGSNGTITAVVDANTISSGNQVIEGKNVVFTATPNNGYRVKEWKLNSAVVNGNTTNVYTLNSIASSATVSVEFEVMPPTTYTVNFSVVGANGSISATVDGNAITSGSQVIDGKTVVFTATPNANYKVKEWKNNSSILVGNTTNTLTISNLSAANTVSVEFELSTGIDDYSLTKIEIYPNPFNSFIKIKGKAEISKIEVSNIIGQIQESIYPNNQESQINTENLKIGVYIIRIVDVNGSITTRKMIKR